MRRFWALIVMVLSLTVMICFNIQAVYDSNNLSLEYDGGTEVVLNVSKRDGGIELNHDDIEEKFADRLDLAGVDNYDLEVLGTDQVRISLAPATVNDFDNIMRIVKASGELSFFTADDYVIDGTDLFDDKDPLTLEYDGATPIVAWNVGDDQVYQDLLAQAQEVETEPDSEGETTTNTTVYVWENYDADFDTYDLAFGDDSLDDVTAKVISTVDLSNYDEDNEYITISTDENGDPFTVSSARSFVNAYNAEDYGFDVDYVYSNSIDATYPAYAMRNLLIGIGVSFLFMILALIIEYGVTGLLSGLSISVATLIQIMIMNFVGFTFTPISIAAIVASVLLGIFININYFQRVKNELMKGKSIEKANIEGYRKSFAVTVESCALVFVISLFMFALGQGMIDTFGGVLLIGSLTSFLFANYLTKWMTYWMMTSSVFSKEGRTFGLSTTPRKFEKKITSHNYVSEKSTKRGKNSFIVTASIVILALLAGYLTIGLTDGISSYYNNSGDYADTYRLNISYKTLRTVSDEKSYDSIDTVIADLCYSQDQDGDYTGHDAFFDEDDIVSYTFNRIETVETDYVETYTVYISFEFADEISTEMNDSLSAYFSGGTYYDMIANDYFEETEVNSYVGVAGDDEHNNFYLYLVLGMTLVFAGLFYLIIHGIYAALAVTFANALTLGLGLLILLLTNLPFNSTSMFAILFVEVVNSLAYITAFVRMREIKKDERRKYPNIEQRTQFLNQSIQYASLTINYLYLFSLISGIAIAIFGGTDLMTLAILLIVLSVFGICTTYLFGFNLYLEFANKIQVRNVNLKKKRFKKKPIVIDKNEPHETIIPGIND